MFRIAVLFSSLVVFPLVLVGQNQPIEERGPASVAQLDGAVAFPCFQQLRWTDTDLALTLHTSGRPVVVFAAGPVLHGGSDNSMEIRLAIDGVVADDTGARTYGFYAAREQILTYLREFNVPRGSHQFVIQCRSPRMYIGEPWGLTVYELPKKPEKDIERIEGVSATLTCGGGEAYQDSDLSLTLRTSGRPIVITAQAVVESGARAPLDQPLRGDAVAIRPTIDGLPTADETSASMRACPCGDPNRPRELRTLSYSRAFTVDRGVHRFGIQCLTTPGVKLHERWMTVYEVH